MTGKHLHIDLGELWRMWVGGVNANDIAAHFSVSRSTVYSLQRRYKLPQRKRVCEDHVPDPTPEEIAERAEIERQRRGKRRAPRVEVRQYAFNGFAFEPIA